jgi:hypothetical protein
MRVSIVTCGFAGLALLGALAAQASAPGFALQDQHGQTHEIRFPQDRVFVLAFADRAGSDQMEGWVRPLYERYRESISIRGVAKLAGVPTILRPALRAIFRKNVVYPVMMDWTGSVSKDFEYVANMANVVVLGPDGRIEHRINGPVSEEALRACFERIDRLLLAPEPHAS